MDAYQETLAWLLGLERMRGWDLKLERMNAALALRRHPERRFLVLHVAGTNGKGSTAAMLDAILRAAGRRTGLYTSPHLIDFAERIRADGRTIPRAAVVGLVDELRTELARAGIDLTHFEFATLLAFEWFARIGIEVAVVEVGLGGRLDATNLVRPVVTAITSIAHDHEEFLGSDLTAIAREKAGILKPGVPLALGLVPPDAAAVITAQAAAVGAPVARVGCEGVLREEDAGLVFEGVGARWDRLALALRGTFQRDNAAVALTTLALVRERLPCAPAAVRVGLAEVRWPGRLAVLGEEPLVVVDGAHNPAGVAALARELPALVGGRPVTLVFAVMADKAWRSMLDLVVPHVRRAVVTQVGRRGLDPAAVVDVLAGRVPVVAAAEPRGAIDVALAGTGRDGAVLIAGSLFLAGVAYEVFGGGRPLFEPWQGWEGDGRQSAP